MARDLMRRGRRPADLTIEIETEPVESPFSMEEDEVEMPGGGQMPIDDLEERGEMTPDLMRKARPTTARELLRDYDARNRTAELNDESYRDYTAGAADDVVEGFERAQMNRSLDSALRDSPQARARRAASSERGRLREYALGLGDDEWAAELGRKASGDVYEPEEQMSEAERAAEELAREEAMRAGRGYR